jgi:hypothetical protein
VVEVMEMVDRLVEVVVEVDRSVVVAADRIQRG